MLILPDRHEPYGKFLLPQKRNEWRTPSQAQCKDFRGNENQRRFALTGRLDDGAKRWVGWFDDREDADAFLWAMACGSLGYERELWELPTPAWHPDFSDLLYDFATLTFLVSPTGSNQTFTSPSDWVNANNFIATIGAGGSGACTTTGVDAHDTGGGGGAYNSITNFTFATPGTTTATWRAGTGGAFVTQNGTSANGNLGGDSWFNGTTLAGSSCGSKGGSGGVFGTGSRNGGAGGVAASGVGAGKNGGRGGNLTGASGSGASSGGGAGGSTGDGGNGVDTASTSSPIVVPDGGNGDAGVGGAGATGAAAGGDGAEWDATHGSGGGGHGSVTISGGGFAGGNYGGGGGAKWKPTPTASRDSGAGAGGIVTLSYTLAGGGPTTKMFQYRRRRV